MIYSIVPESPRWLTWQNRRQEAANALARIARFNRVQPSPTVLQEFYEAKVYTKLLFIGRWCAILRKK